jgi:DNA ligase-4
MDVSFESYVIPQDS